MNEATFSTGGKHRSVIFEGPIIRIKTNKTYRGLTVVTADKGSIGNFFGDIFSKTKKIPLDNQEAESMFEARATDESEARSLLTSTFIEKLVRLSKLNGTLCIQCSFFEDQLIIAVSSTQNLFEPGSINKTVLNTEDIRKFLAQMNSVFGIINSLELTTQTPF